MRQRCDSLCFTSTAEQEWWGKHVAYSKFERQGLNIICAAFRRPNPKALVILLTGCGDTFLMYGDIIRSLYDRGFSVFTYDHQSQGLSDRWLTEEPQFTWVHSFDDYVDDFVFFAYSVSKDNPGLPVYLLGHSLGGLIGSIAMSRHPNLIRRAVLLAPMFRSKCGLKYFDYRFPISQHLTYWFTSLLCRAGLGALSAVGFYKEKSTDPLREDIVTTDRNQLEKINNLRQMHPQIVSSCLTNQWVYQSIKAQRRFARYYDAIKTNTLIIGADNDLFVHNRAMAFFVQKAAHSQMFVAPNAMHSLLFENELVRGATSKVIIDYFTQTEDDVTAVEPAAPLVPWDKDAPLYSSAELIMRAAGVSIGIVGIIAGLMITITGGKLLRR